jgi:transient receptor potential cation channel subfamily A protein 1
VEFDSVGKSLLKTSVMMIGEFEYDTIFNSINDPDHEIHYPEVSYILFVIFLIVMSILLMNLLVSALLKLDFFFLLAQI